MLNGMKSIFKQSGLYNFIIKLVMASSFAARAFLVFLSLVIYKKRQIDFELTTREQNPVVGIIHKNRKIFLAIRHIVYIQDIAENFDYYFQSVEPYEEGGYQVIDYSKPGFHTLNPSGLSFYFTSLVEPFETNHIYLQKGNLHNGDVVFDLGAYCGLSTYSFSKIVGESGHVFALEPDNENFDALTKNIAHHNLKNVTETNRGIWSNTTRLLFQSEANMGSGIQSVVDRQISTYEISVVSLDDLCREYSIERVDYVKMDIEGSEVEVLKSAGKFLAKYKPRLIIEAHVVNGKLSTDEICAILEGNRYACEILPQAGLPLPLIYAHPEG